MEDKILEALKDIAEAIANTGGFSWGNAIVQFLAVFLAVIGSFLVTNHQIRNQKIIEEKKELGNRLFEFSEILTSLNKLLIPETYPENKVKNDESIQKQLNAIYDTTDRLKTFDALFFGGEFTPSLDYLNKGTITATVNYLFELKKQLTIDNFADIEPLEIKWSEAMDERYIYWILSEVLSKSILLDEFYKKIPANRKTIRDMAKRMQAKATSRQVQSPPPPQPPQG